MKMSLTAIRKVLKKIAFNPKTAGTMKIVCDMEDTHYWESKAVELIMNAKAERMANGTSDCYHQKMLMATRLLVMCQLED